MAIDAEDQHLTLSFDRTATHNILVEHFKGIAVNREYPLAAVFLLLDLSLRDLTSALWAEGVISAKPLATLGARQLKTAFQMLDDDRTVTKINIFYRDTQGFRDAATRVR
jgi:hypothetical protein